jgi:SET domain-containing protein
MPTPKKRKIRRRIVVRCSGIHGNGVFANMRIPKGTRIIEYKGKLITEAAADAKYGDDEGTHTFLFLLENDMVIDASRNGNSARWINHSCDPNCDAVEKNGRVYIEATRDIKPGEELGYDYQLIVEERYTPALKRLYACGCGARKCRGTILGSKR